MDHGHGMDMGMSAPPMGMPRKRRLFMHMSFYWGHEAEILFSDWPGFSMGMYLLCLFIVFLIAVMVEWLSRTRAISRLGCNHVVTGVLVTLLHGLRVGLAYILMLALMSFNAAVFIVVVLGHVVGFFIFGSKVFGSGSDGDKQPDLPHMSC